MKRTITVVALPHNYVHVLSSWDFEMNSRVDRLEDKFGEAEVLLHIATDHATTVVAKLRSTFKDCHVGVDTYRYTDPEPLLEIVEDYRDSKKDSINKRFLVDDLDALIEGVLTLD